MKKFMDENFLLTNEVSEKLYHEYAKDMPIYDYHCHISPKDIAEDKRFKNITEIWLYGDHYKWRAMRSNGVDEKYITGDASDYEKFLAWAKTVPYCMGNPLYHWTHLELKRFFGIDQLLNEETADEIWNKCNEIINSDKFSARQLIKDSNVKVVCTTDDPIDTLEYHAQIAEDNTFDVKVLPAFRPDKGINIENETFQEWVRKLSEATNTTIDNLGDLLKAIEDRINYFHSFGCRISDHALDRVVFEKSNNSEVESIFVKALNGEKLDESEVRKYKTYILLFLGGIYSEKGWTMQLHIGAMRNNNTRMFAKLGPDTGFDSISDFEVAEPLSRILDSLEQEDKLPKTILYTLNPKDNEVLGTMLGNFQGDVPGKIQFGSGWWFNDQKDGMIRQMTALANLGLLSRFVGMLTDSRSFLSYPRHEYFRRILCDLVGQWVYNGEFPYDEKLLGSIIKGICYENAVEYFGIDV